LTSVRADLEGVFPVDGAEALRILLEPTLERCIVLSHGTPVQLGSKDIKADGTEDPALNSRRMPLMLPL
jgi:hypothetical protein